MRAAPIGELRELLNQALAAQPPAPVAKALDRAAAIVDELCRGVPQRAEPAPVVFPMSREQRDRLEELIVGSPDDEFWLDMESTPEEVYLRQHSVDGREVTHTLEAPLSRTMRGPQRLARNHAGSPA